MGSPFKSTFDLAISGLVYVEFLATRPTTFNSISGTYKCIAESAEKKVKKSYLRPFPNSLSLDINFLRGEII